MPKISRGIERGLIDPTAAPRTAKKMTTPPRTSPSFHGTNHLGKYDLAAREIGGRQADPGVFFVFGGKGRRGGTATPKMPMM